MIRRCFTRSAIAFVLAFASASAAFADAPNAAGRVYHTLSDGIGFPALDGRWRCTTADGKPRIRSYVAEDGFLAGRDTNGPVSGPGTSFELESFVRTSTGIAASTIDGTSAGALSGDTLALHGTTAGGKPFDLTYAVDGTHLHRTVVEGGSTVSDEQCIAQQAGVPTSCMQANQAARTVVAAEPQYPEQASSTRVSGTVEVLVMLDAASDIVGAQIFSSPSPLLNEEALLSAMRSTFRTEIVNCTTKPSRYIFSVEFDLP